MGYLDYYAAELTISRLNKQMIVVINNFLYHYITQEPIKLKQRHFHDFSLYILFFSFLFYHYYVHATVHI